MRGEYITDLENLIDCNPIVSVADLYPHQQFNLKGVEFSDKDKKPAIPCGLIAKSVFTDTFALTNKNDILSLDIKEDGIAWASDLQFKFEESKEVTGG